MLKRGQYANLELWFVLIGLVIAAVAGLSFLNDASGRLDGTLFEKNYIARDLAVAVDAIYASPGDVSYTYSLEGYSHRYLVDFRKGRVVVRGDGNPVSYRVVGVAASSHAYVSSSNPDGLKVAPPDVIMTGTVDEDKPVKVVLSKKFNSDGSAVVRVTGDNAEFCTVGIDCEAGEVGLDE